MIPLHDDNPIKIKPIITWWLIACCVLVFLWQLSHSAKGQMLVIYQMGVIPLRLLGDPELPPVLTEVPAAMTMFTSMFMHGGWMHLLGNMLYLWIFGNNIEEAMGHVRFILFYLLCGVVAVFAQAMPDPDSTIPMVGASGAISGILGAYLVLYPRTRVLVLIPLGFFIRSVWLPAAVVLGFWFLLQLFQSQMASEGQGGVAFGAHIGGFIAGLILVWPFLKKPRWPVRINRSGGG